MVNGLGIGVGVAVAVTVGDTVRVTVTVGVTVAVGDTAQQGIDSIRTITDRNIFITPPMLPGLFRGAPLLDYGAYSTDTALLNVAPPAG